MIIETFLISVGGTIGTNILIELGKYLKKKSRCKMRIDVGEKSEEQIVKKNEVIKLKLNE